MELSEIVVVIIILLFGIKNKLVLKSLKKLLLLLFSLSWCNTNSLSIID